MSTSLVPRFLSDCIVADTENSRGLTEDELYGVYVSWCQLNQQQADPSDVFWIAMAHRGYRERRRVEGRFVRPGLAMTGPSAVDYILSSQPSLV